MPSPFLKLAVATPATVTLQSGCASTKPPAPPPASPATRCATTPYISGLDPAMAYAERIKPLNGMVPFEWAMRWQVGAPRDRALERLAPARRRDVWETDRIVCEIRSALR